MTLFSHQGMLNGVSIEHRTKTLSGNKYVFLICPSYLKYNSVYHYHQAENMKQNLFM